MSHKPIALVALLAAAAPLAAQAPAAGPVPTPAPSVTTVPVEAQLELTTDDQKTLYALGLALSQSLGRMNLQAS